MLSKLNDFMGIILKSIAFMIIGITIVFIVILTKSCSDTVEVMDNAKIEAQRHYDGR
jgi:hypothetical protein